MSCIVLDTETTGIVDPEVIEACWMSVAFVPGGAGQHLPSIRFGPPVTRRFKPSGPISMGAMATHHIMDEDLQDQPGSSTFRLPDGTRYVVGHNVDFDWRVAGSPESVKRIDTLCLARRFWPECDSHSLGALTYFLDRAGARERLRSAHNAETDVLLTARLLEAILRTSAVPITDIDALWRLSESARVPTVMPFGKHKGWKISDVPPDYKAWLRRQPDVDPYLLIALGS